MLVGEEIINSLGQLNSLLMVIPLTKVIRERADHCQQNGYQSVKLIFRVWSQTGSPKLKIIWYALTAAFN